MPFWKKQLQPLQGIVLAFQSNAGFVVPKEDYIGTETIPKETILCLLNGRCLEILDRFGFLVPFVVFGVNSFFLLKNIH